MNLSNAISLYLAYKRSLGHRFATEEHMLRAFRNAVSDRPMNRIKATHVLVFLNGNGPVTECWVKKYNVLSGFYRFALSRGLVTQSPLPHRIPLRTTPAFVPYIYSQDELRKLLAACAAACPGRCHLEGYVLRAVLILLYGAALRLGEALSLTIADVDLAESLLQVRETKFFKARIVPLGRDLTGAMSSYLVIRKDRHPASEAFPFFCCRDGRPVPRHMAQAAFRRARDYAGIERDGGPRRQPRLHDLRHSGAVHRVVAWYRRGDDVQDLLPKLATYLGHVDLHATQRYLTMTPELLHEASLRFERYAMEVNHG
ncbi:tyrosine-type recombinase/integrase [Paraburkholderia sp. D1E]|uniref:tyrosine-type recombinase/integrase n=1 Tax=Paraburkholderia sp. D1E TaxID=3461398 RepID=UPI0040455304